MIGWRLLHSLSVSIPSVVIRDSERYITFANGGVIQAKSADNPDSLRGQGLDFVALDECSFMSENAWFEALRPALADRKGGAIFISTPRGRNYFWRLYEGAHENEGWQHWQRPTSDNPFIAADEIEAAKQGLPERTFRQEFLAEFIEDAGLVFRGVRAISTEKPEAFAYNHRYIMGVDWAKSYDWTVLSIIDATTKRQVYLDRFNQIDYNFQVGRLKVLYDRYRPEMVIAEENAMGAPLVDRLVAMGLRIQGFMTTNVSKAQIIQALALAIEKAELRLLTDETQINELQAYGMERLPGGSFRYGAPEGMHDDTVMALALAWSGIETGRGWSVSEY